MNNIRADFHMHTTASDGKLSPKELVRSAKEEGLDIIAITDHDTTNGIENALKEADLLGIKLIPGIELSTIHNHESIHILGYFKDDSYKNKEFQEFLKGIQDYRIYRARKIIDNLKEFFNIHIAYDEVFKNAKGIIARPHMARAIIEKGYPYSWNYIFDNILSKDSPAYVHNKKVSLEEGIALLKSLNALVVLAHPILISKTPLEDFMKFDFDGIEAIYFLNSKEDEAKLIALAEKYNKFITCGSDFHGNGKDDTKHGYLGTMESNHKLIMDFIEEL